MIMEGEFHKNCSYFWAGHLLFLGQCPANTMHTHYALQVIVNREGLFQLRTEDTTIECGGVIIGSGHPHQLISPCDSKSWVHLLIDHQSDVAKTLAKRHLGAGQVTILGGGLLERLRGCIDSPGNFLGSCEQAQGVYGKLINVLDGYSDFPAEEPLDPRITKVMSLLQGKYLTRKVLIADLARHACLSESRLRHLFTQQVGIPLRRHILWIRLMTAIKFAVQGESLTQAAYRAGFSDSSHLCRTFRRMYGNTLSDLVKNSHFVQVISCFS